MNSIEIPTSPDEHRLFRRERLDKPAQPDEMPADPEQGDSNTDTTE